MTSNWIRKDDTEDCESADWYADAEAVFCHRCRNQMPWLASPWACLNTMSQCAYTGPEPDTNWSHAARHLE